MQMQSLLAHFFVFILTSQYYY